MSNNQRMFIEIRKDAENLRDGRIFKGRGALINHIRNFWISRDLDLYFKRYDILEIVSLNTKLPVENFQYMIENWNEYKEIEKDENPRIIREENFTKKEILLKELFDTKDESYLHEKINHQN